MPFSRERPRGRTSPSKASISRLPQRADEEVAEESDTVMVGGDHRGSTREFPYEARFPRTGHLVRRSVWLNHDRKKGVLANMTRDTQADLIVAIYDAH